MKQEVYFRYWDNEYPEEGCDTATSWETLFDNLKAMMSEIGDDCSFTVEKISKEEYDKLGEA